MTTHKTNAIVDTSKLIALGDAIRSKAGTSSEMTLDAMASAIVNLPTGGGGDELEAMTAFALNQYGSIGGSTSKFRMYASSNSTYVFSSNGSCSIYLSQPFLNAISRISPYTFTGRKLCGLWTFSASVVESSAFMNVWIGWTFVSSDRAFSVSLPNCTTIGADAFRGARLENLYAPSVTTTGQMAFQEATLSYLDLPALSLASYYLIANNYSLISASLPACTYISNYAFYGCKSLQTIYAPSVSTVSGNAFYSCPALTSVEFLNLQIGPSRSAFARCDVLQTVRLSTSSNYVMAIQAGCFQSCYNLTSLYLLSPHIIGLTNTDAFSSTPISNYTTSTGGVHGSIYVPSSLYSSYKTATNWVTYADRFVSF